MIRAEIANLTSKLVSLLQRMVGANITFDEIRMPLDLFIHRSARFSQEAKAWLKGPSHHAMDRKVNNPTGDHSPTISCSIYRRSWATYHNAHSGHFPFQNTLLPAMFPSPISVEGVSPIPFTASDSPALFEDKRATLRGGLVSMSPVFRFRRRSLPRFQELRTIVHILCSTLGKWYIYRKLDMIMTLKNKLWDFSLH